MPTPHFSLHHCVLLISVMTSRCLLHLTILSMFSFLTSIVWSQDRIPEVGRDLWWSSSPNPPAQIDILTQLKKHLFSLWRCCRFWSYLFHTTVSSCFRPHFSISSLSEILPSHSPGKPHKGSGVRVERWAAAAGVWNLWQGKDALGSRRRLSVLWSTKWKWKLSDCLCSLLCFCSGIFNYSSLDFSYPSSPSFIWKNIVCRYKSRRNHSWPSNMPPCVFLLLLLWGQPWANHALTSPQDIMLLTFGPQFPLVEYLHTLLLALIDTLLLTLVVFAQSGQDLNWDINVFIQLDPSHLSSASSIGQRELRTSWGHSTVSYSL